MGFDWHDVKLYLYKNLFWIFVILGVGLLYIGSFFDDAEYFGDIFEKAGIAILSSGVFTAVLKSLQFSQLFKEEIEKVILSTDFIKKRSDLEKLWKVISHELYKQKFPEISEELDKLVLENYFPIESDYYYKDFTVTINIEELTEDYILKYTQTCKHYVVLSESDPNLTISREIIMDDEGSAETFKNEIVYYKLNGEDIEIDEENIDGDEKKVIYKCNVGAEKENLFEMKDRREYSIKEDNTKLFRVKEITKEMNVSISYPDNINISFFNVGLVNKFEMCHVEHNRVVSRIHKKGLILPHQGFGISIRMN